MTWYRTSRHGGSEKERSIWYHGSRGQNLDKILSQGLITEPKERAWAEDPSTGFTSPSRSSLGGIYVTQNLMTAISSASRLRKKNENLVIVIIEAQPRSFILDEDDINYSVKFALPSTTSTSEFWVSDAFMSRELGTNKEWIDKIRMDYIERFLKEIGRAHV